MAALRNTIFPFLTFPAELRNSIYRHLLVGGQESNAPRYAQILRTCKQINREATDILYAENVVRIFVSSDDVLVYKLPLFSTDIPLQRIETLVIHFRSRSQIWNFLAMEPTEIRANVLALCRHWPRHYALKKLTIVIGWKVQVKFCPHYYFTTYVDPEEETSILSPFSLLRNLKSVSIDSSIPPDVCQKFMDVMHGKNEWEKTV
ncbi:hypothetical protein LPUS_04833 [Lasallia pustulata]|uniref:F-box domain-containing protein n=1 Tax=Lasallia pustulata TaxID=136370 RepID=A0A1W5CXM1_9LECA|nr:hypothetical protein LPUS_04833 [Lasallia pustulata]